MKTKTSIYHGYCFSAEIISYAVFLYYRFPLSYRDVEDLLAERGITVSYETVRRWCNKFGPNYARKLKHRSPKAEDHWFVDEVFITVQGQRHYLWRAIDQDGDVIDILIQKRRNGDAAKRFFRKLLKSQGREPNRLVSDRLGSYRVAHRELMPDVPHDTSQYANNRIEESHRTTREKERQMKYFRIAANAQRFLNVHSVVKNLFNWCRHLLSAEQYRAFRSRGFDAWR